MNRTTLALYRRAPVGLVYDILNTVLWLPGGSNRLRRRFVDSMALRPGMEVLELGCGSGLVTRHLLASGAAVTAVDGSAGMLRRAERRAPGATFRRGDVNVAVDDGARYDRVVLGFLLHELDQPTRIDLLRSAGERIADGGSIAVLEWAVPPGRAASRAWRLVVRAIEPAVALDVLDGAVPRAVEAAGLELQSATAAANGRAQIIIVSPDHRRQPATSVS